MSAIRPAEACFFFQRITLRRAVALHAQTIVRSLDVDLADQGAYGLVTGRLLQVEDLTRQRAAVGSAHLSTTSLGRWPGLDLVGEHHCVPACHRRMWAGGHQWSTVSRRGMTGFPIGQGSGRPTIRTQWPAI
jgi:hypothetical protein